MYFFRLLRRSFPVENTLTPLAEGKTKIILPDGNYHVTVVSKNDLTAGDGAKHDVVEGKAELANQTTCNVFRLLEQCNLPIAFVEQLDQTSFRAKRCKMIPYEVVVRREGHGSYLKRNPWVSKGQVFPRLVVEFFLKTSGKTWNGHTLPKDDPLTRFIDGGQMAGPQSFPCPGASVAFAGPRAGGPED